jgi:hypothetical protein
MSLQIIFTPTQPYQACEGILTIALHTDFFVNQATRRACTNTYDQDHWFMFVLPLTLTVYTVSAITILLHSIYMYMQCFGSRPNLAEAHLRRSF